MVHQFPRYQGLYFVCQSVRKGGLRVSLGYLSAIICHCQRYILGFLRMSSWVLIYTYMEGKALYTFRLCSGIVLIDRWVVMRKIFLDSNHTVALRSTMGEFGADSHRADVFATFCAQTGSLYNPLTHASLCLLGRRRALLAVMWSI